PRNLAAHQGRQAPGRPAPRHRHADDLPEAGRPPRQRRRRRRRGLTMELYLKRWFWTLPLIMISACAILAALGVNHVVEAKYLIGSDGEARPTHHITKPVRHDAPKAVASKD